jgi:hypothetical protein
MDAVNDIFQRIVAWLMNRVRVNQIQRTTRDGLPVIWKRRRLSGSVWIWLGNRFLSLADSGVCMFVRARDWMIWEAHCTRLLYPDRPAVLFGPGNAVSLPEVCGISLRQLLHADQVDLRAFAAAGRELRRVHQIPCNVYHAAWSHGDLHLDNILYDSATDQATLIDFDTRHELGLAETQRHADDLKVMLLELLALPDDRWIQSASTLVREYGEASVCDELSRQLVVPRGLAKILWYTRTSGCSTSQMDQRLQQLREIFSQPLR